MRQAQALRQQTRTHMEPGQAPDARGMGAEDARYLEPELEPQWMDAWKMFIDPRDGSEYGVPVKLPAGQWLAGGPNALSALRRPDGGHWFTIEEPPIVKDPANAPYQCFVGECQKRLDERIKLVKHVRASHFDESEMYKEVLQQIERKVAEEDPRLQKLLEELEGAPAKRELSAEDVEAASATICHNCGEGIIGALASHVCEED